MCTIRWSSDVWAQLNVPLLLKTQGRGSRSTGRGVAPWRARPLAAQRGAVLSTVRTRMIQQASDESECLRSGREGRIRAWQVADICLIPAACLGCQWAREFLAERHRHGRKCALGYVQQDNCCLFDIHRQLKRQPNNSWQLLSIYLSV